jgi:uncharacterized protein DUF4258
MDEPLSESATKRLIREILENGSTTFSGHALKEMKKDNLTTQDIVNVLRGGIVEPGEEQSGTWRYRIRTPKGFYVVVAFCSETELRIVTAWRK